MVSSVSVLSQNFKDEILTKKSDDKTTFIKRVINKKERIENELYDVIQTLEIKKTKKLIKGTLGMKERTKIEKFGECKGQSRGHVEVGIVREDTDCKLIDRIKSVYQESLKDKLASDNKDMTKDKILEKILQEIDMERDMRNKMNSKKEVNEKKTRTFRDTEIKITGFDMIFNEEDLIEKFKTVGDVKKCIILRAKKDRSRKLNIAYLTFFQSIHVDEAINKFDNTDSGMGTMRVCKPIDDINNY